MTDEELGKAVRSLFATLLAEVSPITNSPEVRRKLTLPVNSKGEFSGEALEIPDAKLRAGYKSEFYSENKGLYTLFCPAKGAVTDNAKYPRTELRYYLVNPLTVSQDEAGFDEMTNFERGLDKWSSITEYNLLEMHPKGKIVISQSHAVEAPPDYKVVVTGSGEVYVLCKLKDTSTTDDLVLDLTQAKTKLIKIGEPFKLEVKFDGYTLEIALNEGPVFTASFATKKTNYYPKQGLYNAAAYPAKITMRHL